MGDIRIDADVGAHGKVRVHADESMEAIAREFAAFIETCPSIKAAAEWLFDRGLEAAVSLPAKDS